MIIQHGTHIVENRLSSSVTLFIGSFFVLFSPWGEVPTGWSVGGSCQDPTCRDGAGPE